MTTILTFVTVFIIMLYINDAIRTLISEEPQNDATVTIALFGIPILSALLVYIN